MLIFVWIIGVIEFWYSSLFLPSIQSVLSSTQLCCCYAVSFIGFLPSWILFVLVFLWYSFSFWLLVVSMDFRFLFDFFLNPSLLYVSCHILLWYLHLDFAVVEFFIKASVGWIALSFVWGLGLLWDVSLESSRNCFLLLVSCMYLSCWIGYVGYISSIQSLWSFQPSFVELHHERSHYFVFRLLIHLC